METPRPEIIENDSDYSPSFDLKLAVCRMLNATPPERLIGLRAIVLTNKASLTRPRRRGTTWARKRKVRIEDVSGLYHPQWGNEAAWIEVFVDEIFRVWQKGWWLKVSLWRNMLISDVLYHEIGHHIQATSRPEFWERETVANEWRDRLSGRYFRSECRGWWSLPTQ